VGSLHWLIVIPLFFFAALTLSLSFILVARLMRLHVSFDPLITGASALAIGLIAAPLVAGWLSLDAYMGRVLPVLIVASFAVAGLDALLRSLLPLPLDDELLELSPPKSPARSGPPSW
jgi:hypothetical protein